MRHGGCWVAALVTALLVATGTATAATPQVVAGWPQLAPPGGDSFAVKDGPVLATDGLDGQEGGQVTGFARSGIRRWERRLEASCGNCGPSAVTALTPSGILGPIGFFGGGLFAFDAAGNDVPACRGVIGDDGDCYSLASVYQGPMLPPRLKVEREGHWSVDDDRLPQVDTDDLPERSMAFTGDTFLLAVSAVTAELIALDRSDGRLLWRQPIDRTGIGPVVSAAGIVHMAGADGAVHALDARTGAELWRADLRGTPLGMLADRGAGTGVVVGVRRGGAVAVLRLDDSGRANTVTAGRASGTRLLAVGPDGATYLGRSDMSTTGRGALTVVDARGRERWSFTAPATYSGGVGVPAFAGRDVFVAIGQLMYRLRPPASGAGASAAPARAHLVVAPSRMRTAGDPRVCPTGRRTSCSPTTPLGTVARVSLPRRAAGATVTATLVRVGDGARSYRVGFPFTARPGAQWLAIAPPSGRFPLWDGRPGPRPGAHRLVVRWSGKGVRGAVSAPVSVVR